MEFEVARTKLNRQHKAILWALKANPGGQTNQELSKIALRFGARVWELNKMGFQIEIKRLNSRGLFLYVLKEGRSEQMRMVV